MALQPALFKINKKDYLSDDLLTYIGNKRALLPFIRQGLDDVKARLGKARLNCLDLFAGSGIVSRMMKGHASRLVSNDFEDYAEVVNRCYLTNHSDFNEQDYWQARYELLERIADDWRRGIIAENYAPLDDGCIQAGERVFYTRRNAEYIDTVRQHIDNLPKPLQLYFLAPLLVRASVHNNTAGIFKGFYKNRQGIGAFGGQAGQALKRIKGKITIPEPLFSEYECDVLVSKQNATDFAKNIGGSYDLVYMGPPYNQHPYGSNYFMLNLILHYQMPKSLSKASGIPTDWKRSPFNKRQQAGSAFLKIIDEIDAKYFLISYNSEGFLPKQQFFFDLERRGKLTFFETRYNTYRGSRNLAGRSTYVKEYLFLLEKS
ncbi:MAG: DNA adenine methylase [Chloroflexi bacterium]|nr:DNA adenine methylase [Chloroflexota bacterium]MDE2649837.1 DNA adenine methylase [Chloroflexota bacterium]